MKILVVCQYYWPEPFRIADLCSALVNMGHEVSVLTGIPNYPEGRFYRGYGILAKRQEIVDGVHVMRVPIIPRGHAGRLLLTANYLAFIVSGAIRSIRITRGLYDIILVYQLSPVTMAIPGVIASVRASAPMIMYVTDLWPESLLAAGGTSSRALLAFVGKVVDWIYRHSDRILVTSQGFIGPIVSRGHAREKVHYLPQYPEEIYQRVEVAPDDPIRVEMPKGFVIVFTGNVGVAQGLEVVINAAQELRQHGDIRWVIIGDGRARSALQEEVKERDLNDRILFLGRQPMHKIPGYLALSDVALVSLRAEPLFALTLPTKIQSYLACGIPIVGSVDGDAARVIRESRAGLAGPAGDSSALARNVLRMYKCTPQERGAFAKSALEYFSQHFRKDKLLREIAGHLNDLAIGSRSD